MPIKADGITERLLSDEPADLPDETEAESGPGGVATSWTTPSAPFWTPPSGAPGAAQHGPWHRRRGSARPPAKVKRLPGESTVGEKKRSTRMISP